ncbi:MAG: M48 family metallopeptidase [Chloroflexi bacterium]|nr:M48 family metallopeptidase [Chloroflexota bacterium]
MLGVDAGTINCKRAWHDQNRGDGTFSGYNQGMHDLIDEIKYSQRKTMAIEVKPGGRVIVRVPKGTRKHSIELFVRQKADWIKQAKARMVRYGSGEEKQQYHDGAQFLYLGHFWKLQLVDKVKNGLNFSTEKGFLLQRDKLDQAPDLLKDFYREETRRLATAYISQYAVNWGLTVGALRITSAKTRWGSCSAKNGLNFSYRLAMVPKDAFEYVVVHELAHTRHHNHSTAFWNFLEQMLPDFQKRRLWLKQNGRKLPIK